MSLTAILTVLADAQITHGIPLAPIPIEQAARDRVSRPLADGLVDAARGARG